MKLKNFFIISFLLTISSSLWAHGYIKSPASRAYKCAQSINKMCGNIIYEPQSVEQLSGFPDKDFPRDDKLASGGIQRFAKLDEAGKNRWHKTQMQVGDNILSWHLTARHSTANWRFYITKNGWDPNVPLARAAFDLKPFCIQYDGGAIPKADVSIICQVPTDRIGYHVIYGVWQIADTSNSFYQVVDVVFPDNKQPTEPDIKEPTVTATAQPGEAVTRDTAVAETKRPTESVVMQPTVTATAQPGEAVTRDTAVTETKRPTESVVMQPTVTATAQPGEAVTRDTAVTETQRPTESVVTQPTVTAITQPTGTVTTLTTSSNTILSTGSNTTLSTGSDATFSTGSNTTPSTDLNTLLNSVANTTLTVAPATATNSALTLDDNEINILTLDDNEINIQPRYSM